MRKLARGLGLTTIALVGLVPIQATSAAAAGESLNVEPESVLRITNSVQRLEATVLAGSPAVPSQNETVVFEEDDNPATAAASCTTDVNGKCSVKFTRTTATTLTIRAYVQDAPGPMALPCGPGAAPDPPDANADADCTEGQDETTAQGARAEGTSGDDTDVVKVEWAPGTLDVTPESLPVAPNGAVKLTATVKSTETPARNLVANVDAEILPGSPNANQNTTSVDAECTTLATNGSCDLTYTAGAGTGVDKVRAWVDDNDDPEPPADTEPDGDETAPTDTNFEGDPDEGTNEGTTAGDPEPDRTDVVDVNISPGPQLDLGPETLSKKTGESATLTATVSSGTPAVPQNNIKVAAIVLQGGPNASRVLTCTTGASGQCSLTYTSNLVGVDKVRAAIDDDGNGQPNEADATEDVGVPGGTAEPDKTDVSHVTWTSPTPDPDPDPDPDNSKCEQAKKKVKKAKKALKRAKANGDQQDVKKAKKRLKRAKTRKRVACIGN